MGGLTLDLFLRAGYGGKYAIFGSTALVRNRHFGGCKGAELGDSVSAVGRDRYQDVNALAQDVRELLRGLDPHSVQSKPNSYEPTIAESLALALLELDRITSEARIDSGLVPRFAIDFLNRRLSKRLLERYHGQELRTEFERRLHEVLERLANARLVDGPGAALDRIHQLLAELESALLQRRNSDDRSPER